MLILSMHGIFFCKSYLGTTIYFIWLSYIAESVYLPSRSSCRSLAIWYGVCTCKTVWQPLQILDRKAEQVCWNQIDATILCKHYITLLFLWINSLITLMYIGWVLFHGAISAFFVNVETSRLLTHYVNAVKQYVETEINTKNLPRSNKQKNKFYSNIMITSKVIPRVCLHNS